MKSCRHCGDEISDKRAGAQCRTCQALKLQYGITKEDRNQMYVDQDGKCAICKTDISFNKNIKGSSCSAAVDHCHDTGIIRGLLCGNCNMALGKFQDDPEILLEAYMYLRKEV